MRVVMIHGAGGGAWEWNIWRRVFAAAEHCVECPELQPVTQGLQATHLRDYVAQLLAVVDADTASSKEVKSIPVDVPLALVGASLGGLLALMLAARRACAALILVNPMPPSPEAEALPPSPPEPDIVPWAREASLSGTRRAVPDADPSTWMFAQRRWRDESGAVLDEARAGCVVGATDCPVLIIASDADADVPPEISARLARRLDARLDTVPGSHVGPLLGRDAAHHARTAVHWLNEHAGA